MVLQETRRVVMRLCCAESISILLNLLRLELLHLAKSLHLLTESLQVLTPHIYNRHRFSIDFPKMLKDHLKSHGGRYNVFLVLNKLYIDPNEDYIYLRPPGGCGYRCDLLALDFSLVDSFTLWEDLAP